MKDFRNDLLNRREVTLGINHSNNPGFDECLRIVAEQFETPAENISVKNVKGNFGSGHFLIEAFIYDTKEHKERLEPKSKIKQSSTNQSK